MLALSTSWIAGLRVKPRELVQALETVRIDAVELEYRLTPPLLQGIREALAEAGIRVTSLHNYCPHPGIVPRARPSGDYFRLSARDPEERKLAVRWTARTIENAQDLEARQVVLHCGAIEGGPVSRILMDAFQQFGAGSEALQTCLVEAAELRERTKGLYLDALRFSLDRLLPIAERRGVGLALENRFHYHELPAYDDLAAIFKSFEGAPLGYWHDTGHAHAQQMLGVVSQAQWLKRYEPHLKGFHLHDARGLDDHLPPGEGDIDWQAIRPWLQADRPLVLELASGTEVSQLARAAEFARGLLSSKNDVAAS